MPYRSFSPLRLIAHISLISVMALSLVVTSQTSVQASALATSFKQGTVDPSAEQDFLNRTNALRASLGLGSLKSNSELLAKARAWSQTQANAGSIFHSTLTDGVTQDWYRLGENVGMGPEVGAIHDALVRSPRHYENLADPTFTDVGIGVVRQGDVIYVSQVFMELMPSKNQTTNNPPQVNKQTAAPKAPASLESAPKAPSEVKGSTKTPGSLATTPHTSEVVAESVPMKTATPELNAIIARLSELES